MPDDYTRVKHAKGDRIYRDLEWTMQQHTAKADMQVAHPGKLRARISSARADAS